MLKLPRCDEAIIPEAKLVRYLLSFTHESGRDKAVFFTHFGFTTAAWQILASALRQHAVDHAVAKVEPSPFGERYVVEGPMQTPSGRAPTVRTVWFIEAGETAPRFITAYPLTGD